MRTLKLTLAYDGTRLVGWQRQQEGESVQGLLEHALAGFEGAPVTVVGAGRTDAGVHALGQVASARVSCPHSPPDLLRGLNAVLPFDIRVLEVVEAPDRFHARFDARQKRYRYLIRHGGFVSPFERDWVWHVREGLDLDAMQAAATQLIGTHDFSAFQSAGSNVRDPVRTVSQSTLVPVLATTFSVTQQASLAYEVTGTGFLRHMVRAIVGTLVEVGRGSREATSMAHLLATGRRADAGATAPARGLFLVAVDYD